MNTKHQGDLQRARIKRTTKIEITGSHTETIEINPQTHPELWRNIVTAATAEDITVENIGRRNYK